MYEASSFECARIAQDLQIRKVQVESVVDLFNEGNTVPFITRYRKERTGGLDEDAIRQIQARLNFVKQLNERKQTILKSIEAKGKLTDELRREIQNAATVRRLEDLYLPFKPKKKSLAAAAKEKGLEPLALAIWHSDPAADNLAELLPALVNPEKQLNTVDDVRTGAQHILAELINETAEVRAQARRVLWRTGGVGSTRNEKAPEGLGNEYKPYFQFKEAAQDIRPHRILALNRGEKEGFLKVKLEWPAEVVQQATLHALAEHLLKVAGKPPVPTAPPTPAPGNPPAQTPTTPPPPAPGNPPAPEPAPAPAPETPSAPPEHTPAERPEMPPANIPAELPQPTAPERPPAHGPAEIPMAQPPLESPPLGSPPEMPPPPHASASADSLTAEARPSMRGDPLADGTDFRTPHVALLKTCLDDALNRLLLPSLEREIRSELTDEAELHAVKVFAHNIRSLLMQPPLIGRRVLAIDPGFRTGCKLAALDEFGNLIDHTVIFPHGGAGKKPRDKDKEKDKKPQDHPAPDASATANPSDNPVGRISNPSDKAPTEATSSASSEGRIENPSHEGAPSPTMPAEIAAATTPTPEMGPVVDQAATPTPPAEPAAPPVDKRAEAKAKLEEFVKKHQLSVIALGNGTACRETEELIAEVIASSLSDMSYVIVSEAGASVYSVSPVAKEEFPNLDATLRSGASIGRRLQDPLSELVKIDPQSLGVGLYQHDMGRKELKEALEGVVESCVNQVGVDINTASVPLLRYVSGLNQMVAREIADRRKNQGPFTSREQLLSVSGMGPARYTQAAGFLKIPTAPNPLDRTWIHPESYPVAEKILAELGYAPGVLDDKGAQADFLGKLKAVNVEEMARKLDVGAATVADILQALAKPGRDPREELPPPIFKKGILKLDDLQTGMELKGTVLNVVDFGAFVDVGLKDSGLVHISQMANKYIKSPYDVVSVNDIVTVWVLKIDKDNNHVSLSMIKPGTERKPPERRPAPPPRREGAPQDREQRPPPPRGRGGPPPGRGQGSGPPRERQPAGQEQRHHGHGQQGGRPPRGRGGPPRDQRREEPAAPPPPPPPPRKPRREAPKPKLTQAAIEGKAPLRTLGELAAFFAAKEEKDKPQPPVEPAKEISPPETPPQSPPASPG